MRFVGWGQSPTCTPWMGCPEKRSTTVPDKVTVGPAGAGRAVGAVGAPGMFGRLASHALEDTMSKQPTTTGIILKQGFTVASGLRAMLWRGRTDSYHQDQLFFGADGLLVDLEGHRPLPDTGGRGPRCCRRIQRAPEFHLIEFSFDCGEA